MAPHEKILLSARWRELYAPLQLTDYSSFLDYQNGEIVSEVRDRIVWKIPRESGHPSAFLKLYRNPGGNRPLSQWIRGEAPVTLAELEARNLEWMREHGFVAPKLLAWGGRMSGFWERDSFLVTEELEDLRPFDEWLRRHRDGTKTEVERHRKRDLIHRCGVLLRDLHERGFHHPFPYLRHFFVPTVDEAENIGMIDVDSARISRKVSRRNRSRGLAELLLSSYKSPVSQTDRLRFFRSYCGGEIDRLLLKQVLQRFRQKVRRHPNRYSWMREKIATLPFPSGFRERMLDRS